MPNSFFSRRHGCPDCGGMIEWSANHCRHCQRDITFAARWDWADDWAKFCMLSTATVVGSLASHVLFQAPHPTLATLMTVPVAFWYVFHVSPSRRETVQ